MLEKTWNDSRELMLWLYKQPPNEVIPLTTQEVEILDKTGISSDYYRGKLSWIRLPSWVNNSEDRPTYAQLMDLTRRVQESPELIKYKEPEEFYEVIY